MLIFYYGLLFLGTLSISDGVATFLVIALVDFLLLKAIWESYEPIVTWRKKKYEQLITLKKLVKKPLLKKWEKAPLLKRAYIIVAGLVGFALLILFVRLYLEILLFEWDITKTTGNADSSIRNLALAFLGTTSSIGALFGFFLAILRSEENKRQNDVAEKQSKTAIQQSKTAEQGLITDRINKATEGLGKINDKDDPIIELRIGALFALERIAQDSIRDHISIMEILCAYIHTNSPTSIEITKVRDDVEIAMKIIGRRGKWLGGAKRIEKELQEKYILDLRGCNLNSMLLRRANLKHAWFGGASLNRAWLENADLSYTWLNRVKLDGTRLHGAKTTAAYAWKGDFSGCETLTQEQIDEMFLGMDVQLADDLDHPQKDSKYGNNYDSEADFITAYYKWLRETGY